MTTVRAAGVGTPVAGATTVTARALERVVVAIVAETARVAPRDVAVRLSDERGALRIAVTLPVALVPGEEATIPDRGDGLRRRLIERMQDIAGRAVGVVDVRFSGVRRIESRRVR